MKKVEAIVRPSKLKAIQAGLIEAEIPCMTVIPVKGAGLQQGFPEIYRGTKKTMVLLDKAADRLDITTVSTIVIVSRIHHHTDMPTAQIKGHDVSSMAV